MVAGAALFLPVPERLRIKYYAGGESPNPHGKRENMQWYGPVGDAHPMPNHRAAAKMTRQPQLACGGEGLVGDAHPVPDAGANHAHPDKLLGLHLAPGINGRRHQ